MYVRKELYLCTQPVCECPEPVTDFCRSGRVLSVVFGRSSITGNSDLHVLPWLASLFEIFGFERFHRFEKPIFSGRQVGGFKHPTTGIAIQNFMRNFLPEDPIHPFRSYFRILSRGLYDSHNLFQRHGGEL